MISFVVYFVFYNHRVKYHS